MQVVDRESFRKRRTFVVCGPTDTDQPAFRWSGSRFDNVSHDGCVDVFKFGCVRGVHANTLNDVLQQGFNVGCLVPRTGTLC